MANKMADKKKNASRSRSRSQSQSQTAEPKAQDGEQEQEQEQGKSTKAVTRARSERKENESKTVVRSRETNRRDNKASSARLTRLRSNYIVRFLLESYYELRYKVTWPTLEEARNMTIVVILLSAAIGVILGLTDLGLSQLYLLVLHVAGVK